MESLGNDLFMLNEEQKAEIGLREKEVQYHNLANSCLALIWTAGTDKLCNYFNNHWLQFIGRSLEQELGNGWAEGVHPDDFNECLNTYLTAFDKHEAFEMEYRLRHVSGEYRWISDMGTPNFNSKGEFMGYIGHCFDISERKLAEQQLNSQNTLLTALINSPKGAVSHSQVRSAWNRNSGKAISGAIMQFTMKRQSNMHRNLERVIDS